MVLLLAGGVIAAVVVFAIAVLERLVHRRPASSPGNSGGGGHGRAVRALADDDDHRRGGHEAEQRPQRRRDGHQHGLARDREHPGAGASTPSLGLASVLGFKVAKQGDPGASATTARWPARGGWTSARTPLMQASVVDAHALLARRPSTRRSASKELAAEFEWMVRTREAAQEHPRVIVLLIGAIDRGGADARAVDPRLRALRHHERLDGPADPQGLGRLLPAGPRRQPEERRHHHVHAARRSSASTGS